MLRYLTNPPNLITLSSMFCGFYAIVLAGSSAGDPESLYRAGLFIILATIFDALDGRVARMTGTASDFGVQLDSLSDLVSFGVAPAVVIYQWGLSSFGFLGLLASFAFAAAGAMRLARFNITVSEIPKGFSQGLTITQSAGMMAAALVFNHRVLDGELKHPELLLAASLGFAFIMVSDVWFRTFKDLRMNARGRAFVAVVLLSMAAIVVTTREFSYILVVYPTLHVVTGILEDILRYARGKTHAQLIEEYQLESMQDDEVEEGLVHP